MSLAIFDVPTEILIEIFQLLDPFEAHMLLKLDKKSKKLFSEMLPILYRKQFNEPFNSEYKRRVIKSVFKQANELEITWGDNSAHWSILENSLCKSNYSATLRGVWWFHVASKFEFVWPGIYVPNIRIKANNEVMHQAEFVQLCVSIDNEETYSLSLDSVLDSYGEWVTLELPTLKVDKFRQTVTVIMQDVDTSRYNHGLTIDYFALKKATHKPQKKLENFRSGKGLLDAAMRIMGL